jgi:hypothetical protein
VERRRGPPLSSRSCSPSPSPWPLPPVSRRRPRRSRSSASSTTTAAAALGASRWLTLGIVGTLTLGLTVIAVRLNIGIPTADSTQIADIAQASVGPRLFAAFQLMTALLLLAAASSSFQAGPGLLKALARRTQVDGGESGILHRRLGTSNQHHTPYWAVLVFLAVSVAVVVAAGAEDQELVLFYGVSVFMSFLVGLLAMAKFEHAEGRTGAMLVSILGAVVIGFTLFVNLLRGTRSSRWPPRLPSPDCSTGYGCGPAGRVASPRPSSKPRRRSTND